MKLILTILLMLVICLLSCSPVKHGTAQPKYMTIVKVNTTHAYARWKWQLYRGPVDSFKTGDQVCMLPGSGAEKNLFIRIR
ncbi:MAG: hypothetical protein ABL876_14335 [Chitinophagaceae bacterium]